MTTSAQDHDDFSGKDILSMCCSPGARHFAVNDKGKNLVFRKLIVQQDQTHNNGYTITRLHH